MSEQGMTREELYVHVWSAPAIEVAMQLGISDVGLAKLCERHRVPKPPRGYWAKRRAGKRVSQPPLPNLKSNQNGLQTIRVGPRTPASSKPVETGPFADQKTYEADPRNLIRVPQRTSRVHPLVRATRERLKFNRTDYFGQHRGPSPHLNIRVSKGAAARALRILNALVFALEHRGFAVTVTAGRSSATTVTVHSEEIEIRLYEKGRRVQRPPTKWELDWARTFPQSARTRFENVPSGQLALEICEYWAPRKLWSDGKRQRLEDCLNKFVVGLVATSVAKKEWRSRREEEERQRQEQLHRRREEERWRQEEEAKIRQLAKMAESWSEAMTLRLFLSEVRSSAHDQGLLTARLVDWLNWADSHADDLYPLSDLAAALARSRES